MNYPLTLTFKFWALGQQIRVQDSAGNLICQVKQKAFKLKEDVLVFADEQQTNQVCRIQADRIIDWSAKYTITLPDGRAVGAIRRQGMKSLWRSSYELLDATGNVVGTIREENPWIKVIDSLVGEIPIVGLIAQRFINPAFLIEMPAGTVLLRAQKQASFIDRRFQIAQKGPITSDQEWLILPSVMMMILLERSRG